MVCCWIPLPQFRHKVLLLETRTGQPSCLDTARKGGGLFIYESHEYAPLNNAQAGVQLVAGEAVSSRIRRAGDSIASATCHCCSFSCGEEECVGLQICQPAHPGWMHVLGAAVRERPTAPSAEAPGAGALCGATQRETFPQRPSASAPSH